jgi:hypothetical protein
MYKSRNLIHVAASAALLAAIGIPSAAWADPAVQPAAAVVQSTPAKAASGEWAAYIEKRYGVKLSGAVTRDQFAAALGKILGTASILTETPPSIPSLFPQGTAVSGKLPVWEALSAAVKAAELKELAYTYSEEKVAAAWKKAGWTYTKNGVVPHQAAQELAAAFDSGLVAPAALEGVTADAATTADLAYQLLGKVAEFHGQTQNALGYLSDDDIVGKLVQAWNESQIIRAEDLQKVVDEGLKQNLITGYNLKDTRFDPHFDPERTITYGHSDIVHAIQLIGLLRSEGIQAKVQLEPKTSAFVYRKEWGEPVQTEDYRVVPIDNGNHIAYAKEYDLSFEFASVEEKQRFQPLIFRYAKRNQEDVTGLLKGSWWQPLYYSLTKLEDYPVITNHVLKDGRFLAQTFSLNEQSAQVIAGLKKINPSVQIATYQFWVDQPFYQYLKGEYK